MAHVEKRGPKRWRARYRGPDGRERSKTFERRSDAQRFLAGVATEIVRGEWVDPRLGRMTLAEWTKRWEASTLGLRPTTKALNEGVVRNYLLPRFGSWPLGRIRTPDVRAMVAEELASGELSNSAVRHHVLVLSSILSAAVEDGRLARNPCTGARLPGEQARRMRFLEPEQLLALADAFRPEHYRPLVLTAGLVGLRWGELAGLRTGRVDLLRRTIRIEEQLLEVNGRVQTGPPKTKAGIRTVTMPKVLVEHLAEHLAAAPVRSSGLAFPTPSGGFMRRSNFRRLWRSAVEGTEKRPGVFRGTDLEGLVFHELRHTAAALAIAAGAHPVAIKERLGHSSITVTMDRYGGLFPRLDEAIAEGLDGMVRGALAAWLRPEAASVAHIPRSGG